MQFLYTIIKNKTGHVWKDLRINNIKNILYNNINIYILVRIRLLVFIVN